jgi:hypothetical protein
MWTSDPHNHNNAHQFDLRDDAIYYLYSSHNIGYLRVLRHKFFVLTHRSVPKCSKFASNCPQDVLAAGAEPQIPFPKRWTRHSPIPYELGRTSVAWQFGRNAGALQATIFITQYSCR